MPDISPDEKDLSTESPDKVDIRELPYLTDNTRIKKMQECPRKRYYHSEFDGIGIVPVRNSVALSKGLAIHKGVEVLNKSIMIDSEVIPPQSEQSPLEQILYADISPEAHTELAVTTALQDFDDHASSQELELEVGTPEAYTYAEQKALIEFAVRGYAITRLPYHRQTHRFVAVEKEHLLQLTNRIILMGRTDGVEQKIDTQGHYIFEFKTSFAWNDLIAQEYSVDLQGLSSLIQVEAELPPDKTIHGINMEFFVNGSRKQDAKDKIYKQETWTIRPWMKTAAITGADFKWKYWFQDQFGNNHNLGKTYQRVNIWEIMTIKEWVEMLTSGKIQPDQGDPFQSVFVSPTPYFRDQEDVESFLVETIAQETRVLNALAQMNAEENETQKQRLFDEHFPRYRGSCINKYRKVCPYWQLCWGKDGLNKVPIESGLFKHRSPHHDAERVMLGGEE